MFVEPEPMLKHAEGAAVGAMSAQAAGYDLSSFDFHTVWSKQWESLIFGKVPSCL